MSQVGKCGVEECKFNRNMSCHADNIAVMSSGTKQVKASEHTCCETFAPK